MIFDRLSESKQYEALHPQFHMAFEFIKTAENLAAGRYDLQDGVYVNIIEGKTSPAENGQYEAHKKYIDIQCLLKGETVLWWANLDDLNPTCEYKSENDCRFYKGEGHSIKVLPGDFYVLLPNDGHLPNTATCSGAGKDFKVAVAKVPIR